MAANIGWFFNKEYYKGFDFNVLNLEQKQRTEKTEIFFQRKNKELLNINSGSELGRLFEIPNAQKFELKTVYPGFISGTGYQHSIGAVGEFKIGFHFDHTTGMPYLPGSGVKGVLKSVFENPDWQWLGMETLESITGRTDWDLKDVTQQIFGSEDGQGADVFLDAYISAAVHDGKVLGTDSITPHPNPLKNPVPLLFLKVLPSVQFTFQFLLTDYNSDLTACTKKKVFKTILETIGAGAKTNVGYGQFN